MKKTRLAFVLLLFAATTVTSQTNNFSLTDTSVYVGQNYTIWQIKFDLGKATLRPESSVILDSIVSFMNTNSKVVMEIQGHSDSRINHARSTNLPQARAQSISQYLIDHGISANRLYAKGWGEKKPLVKDDVIAEAKTKQEKEVLHALNRRVVLVITSVSYVQQ